MHITESQILVGNFWVKTLTILIIVFILLYTLIRWNYIDTITLAILFSFILFFFCLSMYILTIYDTYSFIYCFLAFVIFLFIAYLIFDSQRDSIDKTVIIILEIFAIIFYVYGILLQCNELNQR